jgi:hypothetical protein
LIEINKPHGQGARDSLQRRSASRRFKALESLAKLNSVFEALEQDLP